MDNEKKVYKKGKSEKNPKNRKKSGNPIFPLVINVDGVFNQLDMSYCFLSIITLKNFVNACSAKQLF